MLVIEFDELNKAVGFKGSQAVSSDNGFAWIKTVGMKWHKDFILMEVHEKAKYKPIEGVEEILVSEYDKMAKLIK